MIKILSIFCVVLVFACNSSGDSQNIQTNTSDSSSAKAESNLNEEDKYILRYKMLGIDNLKDSLNKTQIRIWQQLALSDSGKILIIKGSEDRWTGSFHQYKFNWNDRNEDSLISHNVVYGEPSSGWNNYLRRITQIGVYNLTDTVRAKNYGLCTEGGEIWVEVVNGGKYQDFKYPCWTLIKDQTQIDRIKDILAATEKEFNFIILPLTTK